MLSILIPAHNESKYLNTTIRNAYDTAVGPIEVIVVDQGGNGEIDPRAIVITPNENVGERHAMNLAAEKATGTHLFRIDAHCDFSPAGWDDLLCDSTGPSDLTITVLTATNGYWEDTPPDRQSNWLKQGHTADEWPYWERIPGHWYGFARIIVNDRGGLECKWQKPNRDRDAYAPLEPNMGATGCGMCIRRDFYWTIGGADESLPKMGAIGEEFAIKTWHHNLTTKAFGRVQTRTDVMVGHIFGTGGYDTSGVIDAQIALNEKYGSILPDVIDRFPDWDVDRIVKTDQPGKPIRTVTVDRVDTTDTTDAEGNLIRRKKATYRYVWLENEHLDESAWTDKQIEEKYAPLGVLMGETITYPDKGVTDGSND